LKANQSTPKHVEDSKMALHIVGKKYLIAERKMLAVFESD